jgi:hypothetical protein
MVSITIVEYETAIWIVFLVGCLILFLVYDIASLVKRYINARRIQHYHDNIQAFFLNVFANA